MAKSKESFNKKEKEKKRLKQKQDKKQRMEERKAGKKSGQSLEGMLAYLDEDGNLTDTPPDPKNKKEFALEDIQIGVPSRDHEIIESKSGTISFYNKAKGFGFINDATSGERLFFHNSELLEPIEEQDKVSFKVERGPRGLNAVAVAKLS